MAGYGDDSAFAAWLTANGYTLPGGAPAPAVLRQRGSVYVDGLYGSQFSERTFSGVPTGGYEQERAWPRTGAMAYGVAIPEDIIPVAVVQASYAAAYQEAGSPGSLAPTASAAGQVKREKVGPLETEYFDGTGQVAQDAMPILPVVEGLLAPFLLPIVPTNGPAIWSIGPRTCV